MLWQPAQTHRLCKWMIYSISFCHHEVSSLPVKIKRFFVFWVFLVCLIPLSPDAYPAEIDENVLWSMDFESVTISDALKQIAQITGIKIITPKGLGNQVITNSYKNRTIEHILKDMFRDTNYALVWSYSDKGIDSVRIITLDKWGDAGAEYSPEADRSTIRDYPSARSPAQRPLPPKRGVSAPRGSEMDSESDEAEPDASAEQAEKEAAREEVESKEEEEESQVVDEASDEEAPKPSTKSRAPTVEGTERGEEESPAAVRQNEEESDSS